MIHQNQPDNNISSGDGLQGALYRVAIVGAGPSGFYAAEALQRSGLPVEVDLFEKLPVPYGLVRYGVAPDHQKLKKVTKVFDRIAEHPDFAFFGNVEIGKDLSVEELRASYHATILACGAEQARKLNIPGEPLRGSVAAREFVGWYNGHPDYQSLDIDFNCDTAVIIGNGNVALDVARILLKSQGDLLQSDIADGALRALSVSHIRNIHIVGRRGPQQAKFSTKELREICAGTDWKVQLDEKYDVCLKSDSAEENLNIGIFREHLLSASDIGSQTASEPRKKLHFDFFATPVRLEGCGRVEKVVFKQRQNKNGAVPGNDEDFEVKCGLVVSCVGYEVVPLHNVPFNRDRRIFHNIDGRVLTLGGEVDPGLYVAGWAKRGPQGTIGTNRGDSDLTIAAVLEDFRNTGSAKPAREEIATMLRRRGIQHVSFEQWKGIDAQEVERGAQVNRPRIKFTSPDEILKTIGNELSVDINFNQKLVGG